MNAQVNYQIRTRPKNKLKSTRGCCGRVNKRRRKGYHSAPKVVGKGDDDSDDGGDKDNDGGEDVGGINVEDCDSSGSETLVLVDDNIIVDKLADLRMSFDKTETHHADVTSTTTLRTVPSEDIVSLLSIVESVHQLICEIPEPLKKWYQDVLEGVRKLSGTPSNSPQHADLSSSSFNTFSTTLVSYKETFDQSVTYEETMDQSVPGSETIAQSVHGSLKPLDELPKPKKKIKNWLPANFIAELQDINAGDKLISIKMGLTGFLLDYYKTVGNFLDDVFDSTTFRPLGKHRQDVCQPLNHGVFYLNHDLYIVSSLLQLYVHCHKQFHGDRNLMIEQIMEALNSYHRPLLSILSLSGKSNYDSIAPNGFCAYLAAATSYECVIATKTPHTTSLRTLQVRTFIL